jgi:putative transposase
VRKSKFSEEQIIRVLREVETGAKIADVCRRHEISEQTYHRWRSKYGGLELSELKRMKAMEGENAQLKRLVADLLLENKAMGELIRKNAWGGRGDEKP